MIGHKLGISMKNITELKDVRFIVSPDKCDIKRDERLLIPFAASDSTLERNNGTWDSPIKLGLADKNGLIVVPAQYDRIYDDFYFEEDVVRVGKSYTINYGTEEKPKLYDYMHVGIIDSTGKELIPCEKYRCIELTHCHDRFIAYIRSNKCALVDKYGNEVLPFGKIQKVYSVAYDFARALDVNNGWCIFDMQGNIIIPGGMFDNIWNIEEKYDTIVVERQKVRYKIPFAVLRKCQEELRITGKITTNVEDFLNYETYMQKKFPLKHWMCFQFYLDNNNTESIEDEYENERYDRNDYHDDYISPLEAFEGDENLYEEWRMNT